MSAELKQLLEQLNGEWKNNFQDIHKRMEDEEKKFGEASQETKDLLQKINERMDEVETRINRSQVKGGLPEESEFSFAKAIKGMVYNKWDGADLEKKALTAGVNADGGFLIKPEYAQGLLEIIRAKTVFNRLGVTRYSNLQGAPFRINKVTGGATGYMIGEGQDITASQGSFGQMEMNPKKAAAMVPISNDLIRRADYAVEQIVRNDIAAVLALLLDGQYLQGNGTGTNILGALNTAGVNEKTLGANGGSITVDTLFDAMYEVEKNNGQVTGWTFHPRSKHSLRKLKDNDGRYILLNPVSESQPATLLGLPYVESTAIPTNLTVGTSTDCSYILAGQWSEAVVAEWLGLQMEASIEASYWDGAKLVSAFSRDETVVRAIQEVDMKLRRPEMFVKVTGVRS
jgi:HK97 family phage major capsid protein